MKQFDDRHLDFVLQNYEKGRFDTRKAVRRFNDTYGGTVHKPHKGWWGTIGGMAAAAALLIGLFLFMHQEKRQWTCLVAESAQNVSLLPDGTQVTISPGSTLRFRAGNPRQVKMSGKIYFDVARDEAVPFEVSTSGGFVRVLGTQFQVDDGAKDASASRQVNVYVAEGKVFFAKDSRSEGIVLTEGMEASVSDGEDIPVLREHADVNSIAWQRGTFIFEDVPLKDVLDCLSAHYGVSFAATGLDRRLSGEFYADDLGLIVQLIESALDVRIVMK